MCSLKICLFCRYFYPHLGGNETQAMKLASELIREGVEVMVVTGRINSSYPRYEEYKGIKIYRVKIFSLPQFLISAFTIRNQNKPRRLGTWFRTKLIHLNFLIEEYSFMWNSFKILKRHREKYDLIHSQMLLNYGYMAQKAGLRLNKPVLIKDASLGGLEKIILWPRAETKRILLRDKGYFIAISSQIAENFRSQGVASERIFTIMNGIDVSDIDVKNNIGTASDSLLFVGNFWQGDIKGLDVLIQALGKIVITHPQVRLRVAGKGDIEQYKSMARIFGCEQNIEFLGQVKEPDVLYKTSAIFVLPSRQEGMSNAVLEAMSYGMPCVVTEVSGSEDQIENGKEGIIVPVEEPLAMAKAIMYFLDHPVEASEMGKAAKEKIRSQFDMRIIASHITDVYRQLIK